MESRHRIIGDPTIADAIMDRLAFHSQRIPLGNTVRVTTLPTPDRLSARPRCAGGQIPVDYGLAVQVEVEAPLARRCRVRTKGRKKELNDSRTSESRVWAPSSCCASPKRRAKPPRSRPHPFSAPRQSNQGREQLALSHCHNKRINFCGADIPTRFPVEP